MKNRMNRELERELNSVHVSHGLKQRILAEAAASRAPSRRKNSISIRPLAIAAAVMVTFGLTAGMIALRTEKPDLSATPLAAVQSNQESVWVGDDGLYHGASICGTQQNMERMSPEKARAEGRKACSVCIESNSKVAGDLVWISNFGSYYHEAKDCSGLENAFGVLPIEAKTLGMSACPVCAGGEWIEYASPQPTPAAMTTLPPTATMNPTPTPMRTTMPTPMPTPEPEQTIQPSPTTTPEPTPVPEAAGAHVWMTDAGVFCHAEEHCSGMENANLVPLKQALLSGKELCPACMDRTIWIDQEKSQWHLAKNCSGVENAQMQILQPGEQPLSSGCMVCMAGGIPVWTTENGMFYHWDEYCSGMQNALQIMESEALKDGKQACPTCMSIELGGVSTIFVTGDESDELYVWATEHGIFYHSNAYCSGMKGSEYMDKNVAIEFGKMRCPNCMNSTVWVSDENPYYHAAAAYQCSGMKDAVSISEQDALDLNKQPCPACLSEETEAEADETSDSVWVKEEDLLYYHSDPYCASLFDVATARRMGKAACAVCAEDVSDDASVWLNGDKHFHLDKQCSELPAATEYSVDEAIESGRTPCVLCANQLDSVNAASAE